MEGGEQSDSPLPFSRDLSFPRPSKFSSASKPSLRYWPARQFPSISQGFRPNRPRLSLADRPSVLCLVPLHCSSPAVHVLACTSVAPSAQLYSEPPETVSSWYMNPQPLAHGGHAENAHGVRDPDRDPAWRWDIFSPLLFDLFPLRLAKLGMLWCPPSPLSWASF